MSNFIYKPKHHARDVFHAWMLEDATYAGPLDMPALASVYAVPDRMIAFSDAMKRSCRDYDQFVHFFEDDNQIEKFWNNPKRYIHKLSKFQGVIGLDYSVCWDFPAAMKNYNYYRNNTCTFWMQKMFQIAVPQARCEDSNYKQVLAGHPKHSTIAIGARSMVHRVDDRAVLQESVHHIVEELQPSNILWYGSAEYGVCDYIYQRHIPITFYEAKGKGELKSKKKGGERVGRSKEWSISGNIWQSEDYEHL